MNRFLDPHHDQRDGQVQPALRQLQGPLPALALGQQIRTDTQNHPLLIGNLQLAS